MGCGILRDNINNKIEKLVKKYKTNNPFEIAKGENIIIIKEPLGLINGYYNKFVRQKMIHVNEDLSYSKQLFTCGHELGHAIFHPNANTPFLISNTFYSVNKLEKQANYFAARLLIPSDILTVYSGYTLEQIACCESIPLPLLKVRFNIED